MNRSFYDITNVRCANTGAKRTRCRRRNLKNHLYSATRLFWIPTFNIIHCTKLFARYNHENIVQYTEVGVCTFSFDICFYLLSKQIDNINLGAANKINLRKLGSGYRRAGRVGSNNSVIDHTAFAHLK